MKLKDIRGKDSRELIFDRQALQKELFELKFRAVSEQIAQTARFAQIRRTVARINTILREREIDPNKAPGVKTGAAEGVES